MKLYEEGKLKTKPTPSGAGAAPKLYPDLFWVWEAFCFLSERRGVGQNGPLPITATDMQSYAELTGRVEPHYRQQLLRFIPPLDRVYLRDFYEKQEKERQKAQNKSGGGRSRARR